MPILNINDTAIQKDIWEINLDCSCFAPEGNFHNYPAKAVPEVVRELLTRLKTYYGVKNVLDPFVGSGTVALESKLLNLDFYGSDLNPLAILLSKTKSATIQNTSYVMKQLNNFIATLQGSRSAILPYKVESFKNIEYWFKEDNIKQLSYIKSSIILFLKRKRSAHKYFYSLILLTAFSATIRASSLTRNGEFKLYRIPPNEIDSFKVNSVSIFVNKIEELLAMINTTNLAFDRNVKTEIYSNNAKNLSYLRGKNIDLVLTSPPYGDSKSTVSYGQFSRLSLQWMSEMLKKYLGIDVYSANCDEYLIGGKQSINISCRDQIIYQITNNSATLNELIKDVNSLIIDEVASLNGKKEIIIALDEKIRSNGKIDSVLFNKDIELTTIIVERIRLIILRKVREGKEGYSRKEISKIVTNEVRYFFEDLTCDNIRKRNRRINLLQEVLPKIKESLNSKIRKLPKRNQEIIDFFVDLYEVVRRTDNYLTSHGIQAWIVGHRTILGKIKVKLADILVEWFKSMNYTEITSLKRQCSFKRMPHHINSTATRQEEIQTMMEEYIIVVQKNV